MADNPKFHQYGLYADLADLNGPKIVNTLEWRSYWLIKQQIKGYTPAIALSFGKDSMTMFHICYKYNLLKDIKIIMWNNSGMEYPDALEMRDYVLEKYQITNYVETCPDNPFQFFRGKDVLDDNVMKDFVFECIEKPRWRAMDKYGINCTILGLRNEESRTRRINYYMRGESYWNKREEAKIILPMAKWKATDIFTYAAYENIPLHPHYSNCEKCGLERETARVNMFCDINDHQRGRVAKLKALYNSHYNMLAAKGLCFDDAI